MQKKCLIGSAGFHLLLLVIMLFGPAFFSSDRKIDDSQVITMVDLGKLTDGPTTTGGKPSLPPPAPEPPKPPPPQPEPPTPKAEKSFVEKLITPAPPKADEPAIEPVKEKVTVKPPPEESDVVTTKKPKVEVTKKIVKKSATTGKTTSPSAEELRVKEQAAARARAAAVNRTLGNLREGLSSGTEVSVPGPGAGTFFNYAQAVKIAYTDAWIVPSEATDESATVKASVTIARDGSVVLAKISQSSGITVLDASVRATLQRVKFIAPFPEGATDAERTFIINFNLKAKRLLG